MTDRDGKDGLGFSLVDDAHGLTLRTGNAAGFAHLDVGTDTDIVLEGLFQLTRERG